MASQQNPPPGEGGRRLHHASDRGLQGSPGQAVDGKGPDLQLWGADIDEQEERDGWPEGGEDPVQKVGWRLVGVAEDETTEADVAVVIWEGGREKVGEEKRPQLSHEKEEGDDYSR